MFQADQYQLLDFGAGRKLERFGRYVLDRPSPAADAVPYQNPQLWPRADAAFRLHDASSGAWDAPAKFDAPWKVHHGTLVFELQLGAQGAVGLFPEQAANWDWIASQVSSAGRPLRVLNLFAHTGGSTLAAAAAGALVTHVDASRGAIETARSNANASGLAQAPIRWIQEDALTFARRELKRGRPYDAVILDPPGYGHGPKGQAWKLDEHLGELLEICCQLTAQRRRFLLLTCHSGELARGAALLKRVVSQRPELQNHGAILGQDVAIASAAARQGGELLHAGAVVRWWQNASSKLPLHETKSDEAITR